MAVQGETQAALQGLSGLELTNRGPASGAPGTCRLRMRPGGNEVRTTYYVLTGIVSERGNEQIRAAEATIIVVRGKLSGIAIGARTFAVGCGKPCIVVQLGIGENEQKSISRVANWMKAHRFTCVLIAVSRELWSSAASSGLTGSSTEAREFLVKVSDSLARTVRLTEASRVFPVPGRREQCGKVYRHGDLLIRQIDWLPQGVSKIENSVLAAGEQTGHLHELHSINGSLLEVYESSMGAKYFVTDHARLTHQEHETIVIGAGTYCVEREREYDYFVTTMIVVAD